jgi:hypothetical protein
MFAPRSRNGSSRRRALPRVESLECRDLPSGDWLSPAIPPAPIEPLVLLAAPVAGSLGEATTSPTQQIADPTVLYPFVTMRQTDQAPQPHADSVRPATSVEVISLAPIPGAFPGRAQPGAVWWGGGVDTQGSIVAQAHPPNGWFPPSGSLWDRLQHSQTSLDGAGREPSAPIVVVSWDAPLGQQSAPGGSPLAITSDSPTAEAAPPTGGAGLSGPAQPGVVWWNGHVPPWDTTAGESAPPGGWLLPHVAWWHQFEEVPNGFNAPALNPSAPAVVDLQDPLPGQPFTPAGSTTAVGSTRPPALLLPSQALPDHTMRTPSTLDSPTETTIARPDERGPEKDDHPSTGDSSLGSTTEREHLHAFPAVASALGYTGAAAVSSRAELPPGLSLGSGQVSVQLIVLSTDVLPQEMEGAARLDGLPVQAPPVLPDGTAAAHEPSSAADTNLPWVGELVTPTGVWGTTDPFLALQQFLGGAEAMGQDLAAVVISVLHSPWVAVPAGAALAAEACRRWARKQERRLYPPIDLPEITGPSGLT